MTTYQTMKTALQELCKNEGLKFKEAWMLDKKIIYERRRKIITLNSNTNQLLREA